jgi:hypothetical protein
MKTIKKVSTDTTEYRRLSDNIAGDKVRSGDWQYCPKSEWKINVRDYSKERNKE